MTHLGDFLEKRGKRIRAKLSGVKGSRRKPAERIGNLLRLQRAQFSSGFPGNHVGEDRTRSNGSDATLRLEASRENAPVIKPHRKPQNIAANRIAHFHNGAGIGQIASVMRAAKMFQNGVAEQEFLTTIKTRLETHKKTTSRTGRPFQYNAPGVALIVDNAMCKAVSQIVRFGVQTD
jgi:hypothetical protein